MFKKEINVQTGEITTIELTPEEVAAREARGVKADAKRNHYTVKRSEEYPKIEDQLDDIYHNGIDGWKTTIKVTKDKYPKP